jgi:hypothetical protein
VIVAHQSSMLDGFSTLAHHHCFAGFSDVLSRSAGGRQLNLSVMDIAAHRTVAAIHGP